MSEKQQAPPRGKVIGGVLILLGLIVLLLWGGPTWNVWRADLEGQAILRQAESERKVIVEQAQAELEAAELRRQAIEIVGQAAKDFPEYRLQEFMGAYAEALQNGNIEKIIFVATEAGIPITEAGRSAR